MRPRRDHHEQEESPVQKHGSSVQFVHNVQEPLLGIWVFLRVRPYRRRQPVRGVIHKANGLFIRRYLYESSREYLASDRKAALTDLLNPDHRPECFFL